MPNAHPIEPKLIQVITKCFIEWNEHMLWVMVINVPENIVIVTSQHCTQHTRKTSPEIIIFSDEITTSILSLSLRLVVVISSLYLVIVIVKSTSQQVLF